MANILRVEFDSKDEWDIKDVTVYEDRAQIVRVLEYKTTDAGEVDLKLTKLPTTLMQNSVRAEVQDGNGAVIEVSAETVQGVVKPIVETDREREIDEIVAKLNEELALLQQRKHLLQTFYENMVPSRGVKGNSNENDWFETLSNSKNLENFSQSLEGYIEETKAVTARETEIQRESAKLTIEKDKIIELKFEEAMKDSNTTSEISVLLNVSEAAVTKKDIIFVKLTYVVGNCKWNASYDIRVVKAENSVSLSYFGKVTNDSGEDWKEVQLFLSTAKPSRGGDLSPLRRGVFRFPPKYKPRHNRKIRKGKMKKMALEDVSMDSSDAISMASMAMDYDDFALAAAPPPPEMDTPAVQQELQQLAAKDNTVAQENTGGSATFKLARLCSIESDNKPHKQNISTIPFKPKFHYIISPNVDKSCYLRCQAKNESEYILVPGPMAVFFNGSFVTMSKMNLVNKRQDFKVYLGQDEEVKLTFEPEKVTRDQKKGLISSGDHFEKITRVLRVANTKTEDVDILLYEQLPLARNQKIKVNLVKPTLGKKVRINDFNHVETKKTLQKEKEWKYTFSYKISWPKNTSLSFTESYENMDLSKY